MKMVAGDVLAGTGWNIDMVEEKWWRKLGLSDETCKDCNSHKWIDQKDGYKICLNGCSLVARRKKRLENEL